MPVTLMVPGLTVHAMFNRLLDLSAYLAKSYSAVAVVSTMNQRLARFPDANRPRSSVRCQKMRYARGRLGSFTEPICYPLGFETNGFCLWVERAKDLNLAGCWFGSPLGQDHPERGVIGSSDALETDTQHG